MKRVASLVVIASIATCLASGPSLAQNVPTVESSKTTDVVPSKLPASLKGYLTTRNPQNNQEISNKVEMQILSQDSDGKITGTFTRYVKFPGRIENRCVEADKLPMEGTYNGEKLVVTVKTSAKASFCQDTTLTFSRDKEHYLVRAGPDGISFWHFDAAD
jgi:hypothetical protein